MSDELRNIQPLCPFALPEVEEIPGEGEYPDYRQEIWFEPQSYVDERTGGVTILPTEEMRRWEGGGEYQWGAQGLIIRSDKSFRRILTAGLLVRAVRRSIRFWGFGDFPSCDFAVRVYGCFDIDGIFDKRRAAAWLTIRDRVRIQIGFDGEVRVEDRFGTETFVPFSDPLPLRVPFMEPFEGHPFGFVLTLSGAGPFVFAWINDRYLGYLHCDKDWDYRNAHVGVSKGTAVTFSGVETAHSLAQPEFWRAAGEAGMLPGVERVRHVAALLEIGDAEGALRIYRQAQGGSDERSQSALAARTADEVVRTIGHLVGEGELDRAREAIGLWLDAQLDVPKLGSAAHDVIVALLEAGRDDDALTALDSWHLSDDSRSLTAAALVTASGNAAKSGDADRALLLTKAACERLRRPDRLVYLVQHGLGGLLAHKRVDEAAAIMDDVRAKLGGEAAADLSGAVGTCVEEATPSLLDEASLPTLGRVLRLSLEWSPGNEKVGKQFAVYADKCLRAGNEDEAVRALEQHDLSDEGRRDVAGAVADGALRASAAGEEERAKRLATAAFPLLGKTWERYTDIAALLGDTSAEREGCIEGIEAARAKLRGSLRSGMITAAIGLIVGFAMMAWLPWLGFAVASAVSFIGLAIAFESKHMWVALAGVGAVLAVFSLIRFPWFVALIVAIPFAIMAAVSVSEGSKCDERVRIRELEERLKRIGGE